MERRNKKEEEVVTKGNDRLEKKSKNVKKKKREEEEMKRERERGVNKKRGEFSADVTMERAMPDELATLWPFFFWLTFWRIAFFSRHERLAILPRTRAKISIF